MSAPEATHHRRSATGGSGTSVSDDSDDNQSWRSMSDSGNVRRKSCESDCSVEEVDLESGLLEVKKVVHLSKVERNCRICHLGLEGGGGTDPASGVPIDLGCSCKGD
ncbi:hypothetical protein D8674_006778 [Pyrus ussuriensis x Pyrus communis]|uniref:Uncharacterized protein n=1 Tax=Pyrus ussuriensis x Pyrus communis TaxID=2448454 RepID=A0A5N5FZQ9_9ROSA|nr:hypothetical protein D8674_006778 [Pyrus ussuriensis x Pyrus communis]